MSKCETFKKNNELIDQYTVQLRLLSNEFKQRKTTKCDDFVPLSKGRYLAQKKKLEDKIAKLTEKNQQIACGSKTLSQ